MYVFTEKVSLAQSYGFEDFESVEIFGPEADIEGLRFQDGDKIYLVGAVRPGVEGYIGRSLRRHPAKAALVRMR